MTSAATDLVFGVDNQQRFVECDLDITSTSSASGESLTAAKFGLGTLDRVKPLDGVSDNGHVWRYDKTNSKMRAFKADASEGSYAGASTLTPTDGSAIVTETFGTLKGGEFANQATGSNTTDPVNGAYVHALAGIVTTAVSSGITNPDFPRNLVVQVRSAGGGALPADMGTVTLIGTDQFDAAVTETLSLAALNSVTLDAGGEVWVVGTKVFKTLTSYQFSVDVAATLADANASVGVGTKLGLLKTLDPATEAAIQRVFKNDAAIAAATYVGDATYTALDLGANLADNDDVVIQYTTDSDAAGGSVATTITPTGNLKLDVEAGSGVDVGSMRVRAYGW